jgi:hypothetical protein
LIGQLGHGGGERDPQLIQGYCDPGNRRPQTEEQKESAGGCNGARSNA